MGDGVGCVVYAAKSTEDRRGSIAEQLRECREAIDGDARRCLVGEYVDEAVSAYRRDRGPGLADALAHDPGFAMMHRETSFIKDSRDVGGETLHRAFEWFAAGESQIVGVAGVLGAGGFREACEAAVDAIRAQIGESG